MYFFKIYIPGDKFNDIYLQDAEPERFSCYVQKYGPFVFACLLVGGKGRKEGTAAIHAIEGKLSGNFR